MNAGWLRLNLNANKLFGQNPFIHHLLSYFYLTRMDLRYYMGLLPLLLVFILAGCSSHENR
jgi:hypothetical protein